MLTRKSDHYKSCKPIQFVHSFIAGLSHTVIQRVDLMRWKQPVYVGNRLPQRDVRLLFSQLLQIPLVQLEHVRFEFGGILGKGALFFDVAADVVYKQLVRVGVQLILGLLKRIAVFGVQL